MVLLYELLTGLRLVLGSVSRWQPKVMTSSTPGMGEPISHSTLFSNGSMTGSSPSQWPCQRFPRTPVILDPGEREKGNLVLPCKRVKGAGVDLFTRDFRNDTTLDTLVHYCTIARL